MTGERAGGGSDGLHTGGAWFYQNKVWKPLDGRGYANSPIHIETQEEECLVALQGKPLFPKNWEVKEQNGRRFIIRDKVQTFPGGGLTLNLTHLQEIEKGIAAMNRLGWSVNDDLVIGRDKSGRLFVVDLSNASFSQAKTGPYAASDRDYVDALFKQAGFGDLIKIRKIARELRSLLLFKPNFSKHRSYRWVYTSAKKLHVAGAVDISSAMEFLQSADQITAKQFTWYAAERELSSLVVRQNNLTLRLGD
jgi:hypothetical protein